MEAAMCDGTQKHIKILNRKVAEQTTMAIMSPLPWKAHRPNAWRMTPTIMNMVVTTQQAINPPQLPSPNATNTNISPMKANGRNTRAKIKSTNNAIPLPSILSTDCY